jgi:hypothetical protein
MLAGRTPAMRGKRFREERVIGIVKEAEAGGMVREFCWWPEDH